MKSHVNYIGIFVYAGKDEDNLFDCGNITNTCFTTLQVYIYDGHIIKSQSAMHCPQLQYLCVEWFVFKLFTHAWAYEPTAKNLDRYVWIWL